MHLQGNRRYAAETGTLPKEPVYSCFCRHLLGFLMVEPDSNRQLSDNFQDVPNRST